jgi:hypothetical protein
MQSPNQYKEARLERRDRRRERKNRLQKWLPILHALCRKYGIECREISGGHQFRAREYILNWWPSSNKINVQYAGSDENRPFEPDDRQDEPRILTAVKKLIRVVKGNQSAVM